MYLYDLCQLCYNSQYLLIYILDCYNFQWSYILYAAVCFEPHGAESGKLPDMFFTASSDAGAGSEPWEGRLNGAAAWCAGDNDANQYLEIDLGRISTISRVATQGHPVSSYWVTQYGLSYSTDGIFWRKALNEDQGMVSICYMLILR